MKKMLAYILAAALLGTAAMMAPFGLFIGRVDEKYSNFPPTLTEDTRSFSAELEEKLGLSPATYPIDVLYIGGMLASSFALALGIKRYSTKKAVS